MKLIADSGATKSIWALTEDRILVHTFTTRGINPYFQTPEEVEAILREDLLTQVGEFDITAVHFYGAGCTPEKKGVVHDIFTRFFPEAARVEVESDMLGAARGLCGKRAGIVCILGTGSNSCFYNGREIVQSVPALGYVLGDEGSGAQLGRVLVNKLFKNQLGEELKEKFLERFETTLPEIIENVYRKPYPNRYLSALTPFLLENIALPELRQIVLDGFVSFIKLNIMQYPYNMYPVYYTGSVAYHFHQVLFEASARYDITVSSIVKDPLDGLMTYHA